ncbi:DUF4381 family protein [Desulfopila inferna]|uniref:DUF4381 family protein n=1 Tax=Desulfopila inferna TaxID=468528 RepID=UPI001962BC59|nr:DUF4381 family protein [Desulfopila inferna]MBM9604035.1 DUF4381 family protein [Desulfopila inferna]
MKVLARIFHHSLMMVICLPVSAISQNDLMLQHSNTPPAAAENQDLYDIYGPVLLPDPVNWPLYIAAAVAAAAVIALAVFFLKRRKKKKPETVVAPHQAALAELASARAYLERGQSLLYAQRISEILRGYIEKRFSIRSTRQTTSEFLLSIQTEQESKPALLLPFEKFLAHCLNQCDLAKYACKTTDREQMEEMEKSIRLFIEDTITEEK